MATSESTTPARRNRSPFALCLLENTGERITAPPLFVQTGESFERASDTLVMECAREAVTKRFHPGALLLNSSRLVRDFLSLQIGTRDHEVFAVILLDPCSRLINYVELFHGTVDACPIYTRPVVQCVVMHAATQVVLVHNHPSGESEPSRADLGVTARIRRALEPIEVRVVDHLIVGKTMVSLYERGLLT